MSHGSLSHPHHAFPAGRRDQLDGGNSPLETFLLSHNDSLRRSTTTRSLATQASQRTERGGELKKAFTGDPSFLYLSQNAGVEEIYRDMASHHFVVVPSDYTPRCSGGTQIAIL